MRQGSVAYGGVRAKHAIIVGLGLAAGSLIALAIAAIVLVPDWIEREAMRQMRERGIELDSYELEFGWGWVTITNARGRLVGVKSVVLKFETIEVTLAGREPERIDVTGLDAQALGSAPTIAVELGAWTKRFPATYALPLWASKVSVTWKPDPAQPPWLEIAGGSVAKTPANTVFSADGVKLQGQAIGKVGASWSTSSTALAIGLGEPELEKAPLKVGVELSARPVVLFKLAPIKLERLAAPFAIELPIENVTTSGEVELTFASQEALLPADGRAHTELEGWIPPHPIELSGFVFGNVTTFDTRLAISQDMKTVTLTDSKVKAGKFELTGGGSIVREADHALARMRLAGKLPCPALASADAESRLGRLLGAAAGKIAGAAARQLVEGTVNVEVEIEGDTRKLKEAKVDRKIGVGCGLKPLTLEELRKLGELLPLPEELSVLAEEMVKNAPPGLVLPPPSALPKLPPTLPPLPPFEFDFGTGDGAKKKAQPAPAASAAP